MSSIELPEGPAVIVVFGNGQTSVGHEFAVWWDDQFGTGAFTANGEEYRKLVEKVQGEPLPDEDDREAWE